MDQRNDAENEGVSSQRFRHPYVQFSTDLIFHGVALYDSFLHVCKINIYTVHREIYSNFIKQRHKLYAQLVYKNITKCMYMLIGSRTVQYTYKYPYSEARVMAEAQKIDWCRSVRQIRADGKREISCHMKIAHRYQKIKKIYLSESYCTQKHIKESRGKIRITNLLRQRREVRYFCIPQLSALD